MNRPAQIPTRPHAPRTAPQRLRVAGFVLGYLFLLLLAWLTGSEILSAACVVILISIVLAPRLRSDTRWPWLLWIALVGGVVAMTVNGHGRTALDLVPLAINLALGALFAYSLGAAHTPMIARAIVAIEGRERLELPRVAGYARALTAAWTVVFLAQSIAFVLVLGWWLPGSSQDDPAHAWLLAYLHIGGYLLPAIFMFAEYGFRLWYLRHMPHVSPQLFLRRLIENWPQLLRDGERGTEHGTRHAG